MWFLRIQFLVCSIVVYGDYLMLRSKETDLEIPEYVEELKNTFPKDYDTLKLVKAERAIAKSGLLKLFFHLPLKTSKEIIMDKCVLLYLPHRGNISTTKYTVRTRDLFTGRDIAHQILSIRKSGWYKVSLNRWSKQRLGLISANHSLSIRLRQNGKIFNFEGFYNSNETTVPKLPSLLAYYKNSKLKFLRDFLRFEEAGRSTSKLPANLRQMKRSTASTSCSYSILHLNFTITTKKAITYISPRNYTTKVCHGNCTPSLSTSSKCNQSVHDCCIPSERKAFLVLYTENANVVLQQIANLIVTKCACASSIRNNGTINVTNG